MTWSPEYKASINCNRPKGFSQRAHCDSRKKNSEKKSPARKKSPVRKKSPARGSGGLRQWVAEKWTDEHGNPCGSKKNNNTKKCRPSVRINETTPVTWKEMSPAQKRKAKEDKYKVGMGNWAPAIKKRKISPKGSPGRKETNKGVKVGKYYYTKSTDQKHKLSVIVDGHKINFGDRNMQHYRDKTGIWRSKDHNDPKRRKSYLSRAKGIKKKDGTYAWKDPKSANYHAVRILW